ncbi:hypothetical protein BT96DRAFT_946048 [Gymnopus androsaceus JB14]|uniref:Uncharacterized protein n=1 Tax=Gymnopus androsaceus JB14 TaxID=1447944 RepID=A0A6A4GZL5_9AGAR|nr:hypothetical protein BT96DRAFT_946048 [Gymnopus androsaceus JB14]
MSLSHAPLISQSQDTDQTLTKLWKEFAKQKRNSAVEGSKNDDEGPMKLCEDLVLHLIEAERYQQILDCDVSTKFKATYMPFVTHLLQEIPAVDQLTPEKIPLILPSLLDIALRKRIPELCKLEEEIQEAQCAETLSKLHVQLRTCQCCLTLWGPGDWQNMYHKLKGLGMRSISEQALSQEEKATLHAAQIQAGVSVEEVDKMLDEKTPLS